VSLRSESKNKQAIAVAVLQCSEKCFPTWRRAFCGRREATKPGAVALIDFHAVRPDALGLACRRVSEQWMRITWRNRSLSPQYRRCRLHQSTGRLITWRTTTPGPIHPVSAVAGDRPWATDAEVGKNDLKRIRLLSVDLNSPVPNGRCGPWNIAITRLSCWANVFTLHCSSHNNGDDRSSWMLGDCLSGNVLAVRCCGAYKISCEIMSIGLI